MKYKKIKIYSKYDMTIIDGEYRAVAVERTGGTQHDKINLLNNFNNKYQFTNFIDIGANYGEFSIFMSDKIPNIFAYEAGPIVINALLETQKLYPKINVNNYLISNEDGVGKIYYDNNGSTGASSMFDAVPGYANTDKQRDITNIEIQQFKIDSLHKSLDDVLIKIDVEGAENLVIQGMQNLLNTSSKYIIMLEYNQRAIKCGTNLAKWLDDVLVTPYKYCFYQSRLRGIEIINSITEAEIVLSNIDLT